MDPLLDDQLRASIVHCCIVLCFVLELTPCAETEHGWWIMKHVVVFVWMNPAVHAWENIYIGTPWCVTSQKCSFVFYMWSHRSHFNTKHRERDSDVWMIVIWISTFSWQWTEEDDVCEHCIKRFIIKNVLQQHLRRISMNVWNVRF